MSVYRPRDREGRPRTPFWHYDFQCGGRRFHGSTGATVEREAVRFVKALRAQAKAEAAARRNHDPTTLEAVFGRFLVEKAEHDADAPTTIARQKRLLEILTRILKDKGRPATIGEIDDDVLARYVAIARTLPVIRRRRKGRPSERPRSPADVNRDVQLLRRIMRRAQRVWKLALTLPDWREHLAPEPDERVVDLPVDIEDRIRRALRPDFRPAFDWLLLSGLRRGAALPLDPASVDFRTATLTIRNKSRRPGGRVQVLPMTRAMVLLLAGEIGRRADAVFTYQAKRTRGGRVRGQRYPVRPETFYTAFKEAAAAAGQSRLSPHDLRHAAGTRILRATGNLRAAQAQLGHSRISTTTRYAHFLTDELRAAMELAHKTAAATPEKSPEPEDAAIANVLAANAEPARPGRS